MVEVTEQNTLHTLQQVTGIAPTISVHTVNNLKTTTEDEETIPTEHIETQS